MDPAQFQQFMASFQQMLQPIARHLQQQNAQQSSNAALTNAATLASSLDARIGKFTYDPESGFTFEHWFKRYGKFIEEDGKDLEQSTKVRLLVGKLADPEYARFADSILPKVPDEMAFADVVTRLKELFGDTRSLFTTELKKVCQMLIELGEDSRDYYEQQLEIHLLRESGEFYRQIGQKFLAENNACLYIHKVNEFLIEEAQRSDEHNLDEITEQKMIAVLYEELITRNMATVVEMDNSGLIHMLCNDKFDDLHNLYELLKRVPDGTKTVTNALSRYLRTKGAVMASEGEAADKNAANNPINYIQNMFELKKEFDRLWSDAFNNDRNLKHCIHSNFEHFLNINQKAPEFLFLYIDDKLKKSRQADLDGGEVEGVLDEAIGLFPFLQEKDVFEKCYRQHLAKRLLYCRRIFRMMLTKQSKIVINM